ncbi:MAG: glycogen/starch synthase [Bacteroidetes bacterium]|nr:glycogen/starch synthase [Bacteroidota bacterium]
MSKLKILYVTHEMTPYVEMTPLAFSARALPQIMQNKEMEVRVFMPRFGTIKERKHRLHEVIRLSGINIPVGDEDNPMIIKVASLPAAKMQIYFLDNDDFFGRKHFFHNEKGKFYEDNDERAIFFGKGNIEIILKLGWIPDIIHCQGWMGALMPMYARTVSKIEPVFRNTKFIYTLVENQFDETMNPKFSEKAAMTAQKKEAFEFLGEPDCSDFYKTGITFSDAITIGNQEVDESLIKMAYELNKPVLNFIDKDDANFGETHLEFYHSLLESSVLEKK